MTSYSRTPADGGFRNVRELLDDRAVRGDAEALRWVPLEGPVRSWDYESLCTDIDRVVAGLVSIGIQPGDFVGIHMGNRPEFILAWFAVQSIGAVMVSTNVRSSTDELSYALQKARVRLVLTEREREQDVRRAASTDVVVVALDEALPAWTPSTIDLPQVRATDLAGVQFTSGTTSRPKGVVWTHANYLWGAEASASHERLVVDDRHLTYLPLFHTNAQIYSVMATIWAGGTIVLLPRFSTSRFWPAAISSRATWCSMIHFSLRALQQLSVPDDHHFRMWGVPAVSAAQERYFSIPTIAWWGMTETVTHGIVSDPDGPRHDREIGRAAPGYDLRIESDPHDSDTSSGEIGSLEIRGRRGITMALGYLDDPAADAEWDDDGWFATGDRVRRHDDGWFEFLGRDKDLLKVGGENVSAAEVERVIGGLSGVSEAAVVAGPDPMLGEVPVAFVVASSDALNREELAATIQHACRAALADFKVPRSIRFVDDLPRATLEKVAKAQLRRLLAEEFEVSEGHAHAE